MDAAPDRRRQRGSRLTPVAQPDPLLPAPAAAAYLGLAPHTLENWRSSRRPDRFIPYVRVGGLIRYRQSALDAFLRAGEVAA